MMEWMTMYELQAHIQEYGKHSYDGILVEDKDGILDVVYDHGNINVDNVKFVSVVIRKER